MAETAERERLSPEAVRRVRLVGLLVLALCLSAVLFDPFSQDVRRLSDGAFDMYQRAVPRAVPSDSTVRLVQIDQASLDEYGAWPWPRTRLAKLAQKILDQGAYVVGFDMLFLTPDRYGAANLARIYPNMPAYLKDGLEELGDPDKALEALLQRGDSFIVLGRSGILDVTKREPDDPIVWAEFTGGEPQGLLSFDHAITNIARLDHAAAGIGLLNGPRDPDGVVRRLPIVASVAGKIMPSFPLELVRVAIHADYMRKGGRGPPGAVELELSAHGTLRSVTVEDASIPVQPDGTMWLHYSDGEEKRALSAIDVLDGSLEKGTFYRKTVIVGLAALAIEDVVSTPMSPETSGSFVHAQALESILYGQWLLRPFWTAWAEVLLAIAAGLAAIVAFPRLSPLTAVLCTATGIVAAIAVSFGAFAAFRLVTHAVVPLIGAGVPAVVMLCALLIETELNRRKLRDALIEERVSAAAAERELAIARDIQFSMLPDARSLDALPASVEVAARLEPAQSIGGDLYDSFMLDDNRLFFMVGDVSGKGISAALFMARAKALSKTVVLREDAELASVVGELNAEIARENKARMFVTALSGIVHLDSGRVELCDAGHERPVVIRADGSVADLDIRKGVPLCTSLRYAYRVDEMQMAPGDILVVVSDGVTEAQAPDEDRFGRDRLRTVLGDGGAPRTGEGAASRIADAVRTFEADNPRTDDLTVLAIRYKGAESA